MAEYIADKGMTIILVAVGGAVSTMYLGTRPSTGDVDFFLSTESSPENAMLLDAANYANKEASINLGRQWFNNMIANVLPPSVLGGVVDSSLRQNVVIYENVNGRGGIRIYAVTWAFVVAGKCDCLKERKSQVKDSETRGWCQMYGKRVNDDVLRALEAK